MNLRLLPLLLVALLLVGCRQQVLYSDLTEQEANEIMALLYAADLPASKVAVKGGNYRVDTSRETFSEAMTLLQANGLPRERFDSLGKVFAKEGFVSSPLEEQARLNHALSQEMAHTLSNIDGVLMARVHLAVPEQELLEEKPVASSASVFIKHRADVDLSQSVPKMKALVVDGVENLPYENVTVSLFPAVTPALNREQELVPGTMAQQTASFPNVELITIAAALAMLTFGLITLRYKWPFSLVRKGSDSGTSSGEDLTASRSDDPTASRRDGPDASRSSDNTLAPKESS
ncbi:MAG: EscJ/YscJ/HrcJ family type III secretion inner membrane ring protein [Gammaproteobacteria bacterium]|nr:MAG: EscJ/YscJ/HrcJ family type III secretion inner membrane ring protein [Gammaproteobacteria bacterium]